MDEMMQLLKNTANCLNFTKTYHWLNCLALKSYPTSDPSGIFWGMVNPSPLIIHLPMNPMSKNPILNQRFWDVFYYMIWRRFTVSPTGQRFPSEHVLGDIMKPPSIPWI